MPITLQLPDNRRLTFDGPVVLIGTDPGCDVQLSADSCCRPQHARLRRLANRWLVESQGDWPIHVGDAPESKTCWLKPGDSIQLTPQGPAIVFDVDPGVYPQTS